MVPISDFTKKVMQQILAIPVGKVATYKQIAELAGKPQGSRGVGWILNSCSRKYKLPWQRVLNSQGKVSFDPKSSRYRMQKKLLAGEGVLFESNGRLDLAKYQWKKKPRKVVGTAQTPKMFGV